MRYGFAADAHFFNALPLRCMSACGAPRARRFRQRMRSHRILRFSARHPLGGNLLMPRGRTQQSPGADASRQGERMSGRSAATDFIPPPCGEVRRRSCDAGVGGKRSRCDLPSPAEASFAKAGAIAHTAKHCTSPGALKGARHPPNRPACAKPEPRFGEGRGEGWSERGGATASPLPLEEVAACNARGG
jgi:hypothetical protein